MMSIFTNRIILIFAHRKIRIFTNRIMNTFTNRMISVFTNGTMNTFTNGMISIYRFLQVQPIAFGESILLAQISIDDQGLPVTVATFR